jgi:hypothetical protein
VFAQEHNARHGRFNHQGKDIFMKKVRINTTLRHKLENYVRSRIDAGIDKTPLEQAKARLRQEALRQIESAYPQPDMAILAAYGKADHFRNFTFSLPDGTKEYIAFDEALPYDLPGSGGQFSWAIPADAAFAQAAQEVASVNAALRAEAKRQWEQAAVLVGCALYFEDVLDYLRIDSGERVDLSRRWHLPMEQAEPQPELPVDGDAEAGEETASGPAPATPPTLRLIEAIEPVIDYAESEALSLESHSDSEEAAAEAEKAWELIVTAREAIAREKANVA